MIFLKLSLLALMPLAVSIGMYLLEKKTKFANFEGCKKQILYGVIFGLLAISSTEFGQILDIRINQGAILNCRDASVLIAGLVFGAPAGLISGFIGGIHRYVAVLWGAGTYTQLACSISTIVAGITGAILRYFLFDNKKPSIFYALMIGFVVEVFHMLMVFFTNMGDIEKAFGVVQNATLPMVLINGFTVMLSVLVITLIGKEKVILHDHGAKTISTLFQRWLLITVLIAYVLTSTFTINMQYEASSHNTEKLLSVNITDVKKDVEDASNEEILSIAEKVKKDLLGNSEIPPITLEQAVAKYNINEINIINAENGIITESTNSDFVGFDMDEKEGQSKNFLDNLKKYGKYVQPFGSISSDSDLYRKYAGVKLDNGDYMQIGYDADGFQHFVDPLIVDSVFNRTVGNTGFIVVINANDTVVASGKKAKNQNDEFVDILKGEKLKEEYMSVIRAQQTNVVIEHDITISKDTQPYYAMFEEIESYNIITLIPESEANLTRDLTIYISIFMEIIVFVSLFILIYLLVKKLVVNNIKKVNDSLAEITGGNLNVVVDVRANEEFASLSDDINATVDTLKHYIAEAAARLDKELQLAKVIQESSLPSLFPPFPERKEFDIFASMDPAKEVGGDFYDFYFLDDNHLAFLVADVSGKGITGAMFMMKAKTLIKSFSEQSSDVADILTKTNDALCEGNDAEMFVTCFMGIIDLTSGKIEFSNAGHNPPLIRHKNGTFEYFKGRTGFVLGGMEGLHYRKGEIDFEMGDTIFVYSDGVTEAVDVDTKMYTENRLYDKLNKIEKKASAETICKEVKSDLDLFVGEAPQFDDITMLCLITKKLDSKKEEKGNE